MNIDKLRKMGKNTDLALILSLVVIGMFIPFLGSIVLTYNLDMVILDNWLDVSKTFGYFLLIFAIELGVVFLYFTISNNLANKKLKEKIKK